MRKGLEFAPQQIPGTQSQLGGLVGLAGPEPRTQPLYHTATHTNTCIHIRYTHIHMHTYIHIYIHTHAYIHTHIYTYTCTHKHTYTCTHAYTCTHTHTHREVHIYNKSSEVEPPYKWKKPRTKGSALCLSAAILEHLYYDNTSHPAVSRYTFRKYHQPLKTLNNQIRKTASNFRNLHQVGHKVLENYLRENIFCCE